MCYFKPFITVYNSYFYYCYAALFALEISKLSPGEFFQDVL